MSRVSQLRRYFMQNTRQQLLLTLIDFWCVDILLHFASQNFALSAWLRMYKGEKINCELTKFCTGACFCNLGETRALWWQFSNQLNALFTEEQRAQCSMATFFFLLESDTFIATQRLQSKLQFLLKTSLFYWQTVFKSTLFPHRHIFHATRQIQWKLQFMFSTKKKTTKKPPKTLITDKQTLSFVA